MSVALTSTLNKISKLKASFYPNSQRDFVSYEKPRFVLVKKPKQDKDLKNDGEPFKTTTQIFFDKTVKLKKFLDLMK